MQVDGNMAVVEVPGSGTVRARPAASDVTAPGRDVTVAVRPERVALVGAGEGHAAEANLLHGVVAEVVYFGTHSRFAVRLPAGETVVVHRQNAAGAGELLPRPGDEVRLAFAPASATVLAE